MVKRFITYLGNKYFLIEDFVLLKLIEPNLNFIKKLFNKVSKILKPLNKFFVFLSSILQFFRIIPDKNVKAKWGFSEPYKELMSEDVTKRFRILQPFKLWQTLSYGFGLIFEGLFRFIYFFEDAWFKWFDFPFYYILILLNRVAVSVSVLTGLPAYISIFYWNKERQDLFKSFWYSNVLPDLNNIMSSYVPTYFKLRFSFFYYIIPRLLNKLEYFLFYFSRKIKYTKIELGHKINCYLLNKYGYKFIRNFRHFSNTLRFFVLFLKLFHPKFYIYWIKIMYFRSLYILEEILEYLYFNYFCYLFSSRYFISLIDNYFKTKLYRVILSVKLAFVIFYPDFLFAKTFTRFLAWLMFRISYFFTVIICIFIAWAAIPLHYFERITVTMYDLEEGKYNVTFLTDTLDIEFLDRLRYLPELFIFKITTLWNLNPLDFLIFLPFFLFLICILPFSSTIWRNLFEHIFFENMVLDQRAKQIAKIIGFNYYELVDLVRRNKEKVIAQSEAISFPKPTLSENDWQIEENLWVEINCPTDEYDTSLAEYVTRRKLRTKERYHEWYNTTGIWDTSWLLNPFVDYYKINENALENDDDDELEVVEYKGYEYLVDYKETKLEENRQFREMMDPILFERILNPEINEETLSLRDYSLELTLPNYKSPIKSDYLASFKTLKYSKEFGHYRTKLPLLIKPTKHVFSRGAPLFYEDHVTKTIELHDLEDDEVDDTVERNYFEDIFLDFEYDEYLNLEAEYSEQFIDYKNEYYMNIWIRDERALEPFKYDNFSNFNKIFAGNSNYSYSRHDYFKYDFLSASLNEEFDFNFDWNLYTPHNDKAEEFLIEEEDVTASLSKDEHIISLFSTLLTNNELLPEYPGVVNGAERNVDKVDKDLRLFTFEFTPLPIFSFFLGLALAIYIDHEFFTRWNHLDINLPFTSRRRFGSNAPPKLFPKRSIASPIYAFHLSFILLITLFIMRICLRFDQFYVFYGKTFVEQLRDNWFPKIFKFNKQNVNKLDSITFQNKNNLVTFWPPTHFFNGFIVKNVENPLKNSDFKTNQIQIFDEMHTYFDKVRRVAPVNADFQDRAIATFNSNFQYPFHDSVTGLYMSFFTEPSLSTKYEHIEDALSPKNKGIREFGYPFNLYELALWLGGNGGYNYLMERISLQLDWILWFRWRSTYTRMSGGLIMPPFIDLREEQDFYDKLNVNRALTKVHKELHLHLRSILHDEKIIAKYKMTNLPQDTYKNSKDLRAELRFVHNELFSKVLKRLPNRKVFYFNKLKK